MRSSQRRPCEPVGRTRRPGEKTASVASPFAPRKDTSFAERKATVIDSPIQRLGGVQLAFAVPVPRLACCWLAWTWLLAFCGLLASGQAIDGQPYSAGDEEANREYAIKAAYIYNFGRYVQWPPDAFEGPQTPLVIGVVGYDPFGPLLDEIAKSKKIEGRPIVARRFASMDEYTPCHILFVASLAPAKEKRAALEIVRTSKVLLIGEDPGLAEQGATINFFVEQNKIRFEINVDAARRHQLKISSKLLNLAKIVGRN